MSAIACRAVIFDFDGVIADTEPLHCRAFANVLAGRSISLTWEDYRAHYLGLNDRAIVQKVFERNGRRLPGSDADRLLTEKNDAYMSLIAGGIKVLPGVAEFVARMGRRPLAICSGARRVEIETILRGAGLLACFRVIVSADEVSASKPDPAGFLRALALLRETETTLLASECLVIEDGLPGIMAAQAAGMRVGAVGAQCGAAAASLDNAALPDVRAVGEWMLSQS
jgi:HAD superfamily hydrolase (TIGR01509 family)